MSRLTLAQELEDALLLALPYVEDAIDDPAYKKGVIRKLVRKIHKALARVAVEEAK